MTKKSKTEEKISTDKRERTSSKVLGLDISTSCIGASVVIDDGWHESIVEWVTHITPKIPKKMEGIEALIHRKDIFENDFLSQGEFENRTIQQTLDIGWKVLSLLPREELYRIAPELIDKYLPKDDA